MRNIRSVWEIAALDIREYWDSLEVPRSGAIKDRWSLRAEDVFNKDTRALNKQLGLNTINYYN